MDLRDLRYFEAIAEREHVGEAAQHLNRTQPALTSSVRRLEAWSGTTLFERAGRGIRLTAAGQVLLRWARHMRLEVQDAHREMNELGRGLSGHVRLGIVPTAAQFMLPAVARRLLVEAPGVTLGTVVGVRDDLGRRLRAGEIDLMVVSEGDAEPGLVSQPLPRDAIVVVACAQHPLFGQAAPALRDLGGYEWVLQEPGSPTRDWIDHAFERLHLPRPRVRIESNMLLMLPSLIAGTELLGFFSRYHLQQEPATPALREVPQPRLTMRRRLVVTRRAGAYVAPAVLLLQALLADTGKGRRRPASSPARA